MKKITVLIILLFAFDFGYGQTTLAPGDIAITGVNSRDPDEFSFVLLTDVLSTTTINFTDEGWQTTGNFRGIGEGIITWTADVFYPCGTEVIITDISTPAIINNYSATQGVAIESGLGFDLRVDGDQILAYQGTIASPTFIYGIIFGRTVGWTDATSTRTSAVPSGLTDGVNAMHLGNFDMGKYDCTTTIGDAAILADVIDASNWTATNIIANRPTLGECTYSCCPGGIATWNGITWSASPDLTTQAIINGDYDTSNGSFSACSLTVNPGFNLNVDDNTFVEVQNDVINDGTITVQPYGAFVQNSDASLVTNNGTMSVDKITAPMDAWYEYTYWSSPVANATIEGAITSSGMRHIFIGQNHLDHCAESANDNNLVCDDGFGNGVQDGIDDNNDNWQGKTGSTTMQAGIGYATTLTKFAYNIAPGTINKTFRFTFEGDFHNGVYTVPIYRNDSELNDINWNFIGNPYPSAIDANLFLAANSNIATNINGTSYDGTGYVDGAIFLWSQDTAPSAIANGNEPLNFSAADFAIINALGPLAGGDGVIPNGYIPSGQGFFISMANPPTPATLFSGDVYTGNVIFNNAMRVTTPSANSQFFKNSNSKKSSNSSANKVWLNLTSDNGVFNQILVGYVNGATNSDDGIGYDTIKYSIKGAGIYSTIDGSNKMFAIQGKDPNSLNETETIKIGFNTRIEVATLYKLSIAQFEGDFLENNTVYLKDNLFNTIHNLSVSDYTFTSEVGEFYTRFEVVFNANALSTDENISDLKSLRIIELDNDRVQFTASKTINAVRIYDLLGRQLYNFKGKSNSETYELSNLSSSIYIAKVELSNGITITKKAFKK